MFNTIKITFSFLYEHEPPVARHDRDDRRNRQKAEWKQDGDTR